MAIDRTSIDMQGRTKVFLSILLTFAIIGNLLTVAERILSDRKNETARPYAEVFNIIQIGLIVIGCLNAFRLANYSIQFGNTRKYFIDKRRIPPYTWILQDQQVLHMYGWSSYVMNLILNSLVLVVCATYYVSTDIMPDETVLYSLLWPSMVCLQNIVWIFAPFKYVVKNKLVTTQTITQTPVSFSVRETTAYEIPPAYEQTPIDVSKKSWWRKTKV